MRGAAVKSIQVDRDIYDYLLAQGLGAGQSASAILRRALVQTIEIDDDLYAYLLTLAVSIGESPSSILRRELKLDEHHPDPVDPPPPTRIDFRIPAGTGPAAWNARERPVMGIVGQTLRIFNDDAVGHRLHTNGAPFPHGDTDIAPGGFSDFVLRAPFDLNPPQPLYDHNFGPPAQFWITVRPAG